MIIVDSHAHLNMDEFDDDRDLVIKKAWEKGIGAVLCPIEVTEEKSIRGVGKAGDAANLSQPEVWIATMEIGADMTERAVGVTVAVSHLLDVAFPNLLRGDIIIF